MKCLSAGAGYGGDMDIKIERMLPKLMRMMEGEMKSMG